MTAPSDVPPREGAPGRYAARTKYDEPGRADRYAARSPRRHEEEWRLVERALVGRLPPGDVLDVPCGAGRMAAEFLARGARVRCGDLSAAMRARADAALAGRSGYLGVEAIDLDADPAPGAPRYDLVLCFRFLHHLPDAPARRRVLGHLAARSRGGVLVSFHHPVSVHQLARGIRRLATRRRGDRHCVTVRTLRRDAASVGLRVVRTAALAAGRRDLWVAVLEAAVPGAPRPVV